MASASQIESCFTSVLGRAPTPAESAFWVAIQGGGFLDDGGVALAIAASEEASGIPSEVLRLYEAAFGRKPDVAGFNAWTLALRDGANLHDIAQGFVSSQEFKDHYGAGAAFDRAAFITALYRHVLDREPDAAGLQAWTKSGMSPADLLIGFSQSPEFISRAAPEALEFFLLAAKGAEDHVGSIFSDLPQQAGQSDGVPDLPAALQQLYREILQRDPTAAELALRAEQLGRGGFTFEQISDIIGASGEASGNPSAVVRLYESVFGHKPDVTGFDVWTDKLAAGAGLHDIARFFVTSQEFKDHYGVGSDFNLTDFVTQLYRHVLDREPDAAGLQAWTQSGLGTADLVVSFSQSQEFITRAAPAMLKFFNMIADGKENYLGSIFGKPLTAAGQNDGGDADANPGDAGGDAPAPNSAPTAIMVTPEKASVAENADLIGGVKVADLSFTDPDAVPAGTYSLTGADAAAFEVRGHGLYFVGPSPNYEAKNAYDVRVAVIDPSVIGSTPVSTAFHLDVTDVNEAPTALSITATNVNETAAGAKVAGFAISDPDLGPGPFTSYTYQVLADDGSVDGRFVVDPAAKSIQLASGVALDYEQPGDLSLRLKATNVADPGQTITQAFTIALKDVNEAPTALTITASVVDENTAGAKLADFVMTDPDGAGPFTTYTYQVLADDGLADGRFVIDAASNSIRLAPGAALNFEQPSDLSLRLKATNVADPSQTITHDFTVALNDVNEAPTGLTVAPLSILENVNGGPVGSFALADPDWIASGFASYTYQVLADDGSVDNRFVVDGGARLIKLAAGQSLDYENPGDLSLRLQATNTQNGAHVLTTDFAIDLKNVLDLTTTTVAFPSKLSGSFDFTAPSNASNAVLVITARGDFDNYSNGQNQEQEYATITIDGTGGGARYGNPAGEQTTRDKFGANDVLWSKTFSSLPQLADGDIHVLVTSSSDVAVVGTSFLKAEFSYYS
ncbi:DUF4214 domain-containing protein [Alsobacter sp. SYSU BS001988]